MCDRSVIPDDMRAAIGVESEPACWDIERGAVAKFARAISDANPLYADERAARRSVYGGLIAPPTFLRLLRPGPPRAAYEEPFPNILDGGSEYHYYEPVRVGDRVKVTRTLVDVFEKTGRFGPMLFKINEFRYVNQFGELVATQRTTTITYPAPNR